MNDADKLIEAVAMALFNAMCAEAGRTVMWTDEDPQWPSDRDREHARIGARAAIDAIEASGTHLIVERRHADDPPEPGLARLVAIPRPIVKVLRKEAESARNGDMVVDGIDIDMAELLEDAATEIERLRAMLSARPRITGETE